MHRHLAQLGSAAQAGLHPHDAGVGQVEAHVSARGLAAQADAPVAGILLPEGEVGIDQRKRQLLKAVLDVDAGVGGLKVRQRACACRDLRRLDLAAAVRKSGSRFQRPSLVRTRLRLASSTLMRLISSRPRHSESRRMDGGDGAGVEHRLGAEGRIFFDGQVGEHKARPRQQPQLNRGEAHRPAQRCGDELRDPALVAADADQGRDDAERPG